jgi:uncharacterized protein
MRPGLPLGLRNRMAELILEAFEAPAPRDLLEALAAFCRSADGEVGPAAAERLVSLGWFAPSGPGRVRLLGAHATHRDALCQRAAAAAAMLAAPPAAECGALDELLNRAGRLADAGLYFEVHELLEPTWFRAEGAERVGLQGLIQVAVALHHRDTGNREGALSLLTEGLAKLEACGAALPLGLRDWTRALGDVLAAWRAGDPGPPIPAWPTPSQGAGR